MRRARQRFARFAAVIIRFVVAGGLAFIVAFAATHGACIAGDDTDRCFPNQPSPGAGVLDPFHTATPEAAQLNADGKVFYRQGLWDQARTKYRAAERADPEFVAPTLNIACSYVRQERWSDALTEVSRILERGYVPWANEILTAADLGALKVRPEMKHLREAMTEARQRWAVGLSDDLLFVGRTRAPLKLAPQQSGILVLGPRQEVFAWSPRTRRFRQLTTEDGRVVGLARSTDGRKILYATAEKLVRSPGGKTALRGLVLIEMDLGSLVVQNRAPLEGDVEQLDVLSSAGTFAVRLIRPGAPAATYVVTDGKLQPRTIARTGETVLTLTGTGTSATSASARRKLPGSCRGTAREIAVAGAAARAIEIRSVGSRRRITIGDRFGAGLTGLPIP